MDLANGTNGSCCSFTCYIHLTFAMKFSICLLLFLFIYFLLNTDNCLWLEVKNVAKFLTKIICFVNFYFWKLLLKLFFKMNDNILLFLFFIFDNFFVGYLFIYLEKKCFKLPYQNLCLAMTNNVGFSCRLIVDNKCVYIFVLEQ